MNPVAKRLKEERDSWRRNPPEGFKAGPSKNPDGTLYLFKWDCEIPGPRNTPWESGRLKFYIQFDATSLTIPPSIRFTPAIFHPNVSPGGYICSSLAGLWPEISIKQLIFTVQSFVELPNPYSALNCHAAKLYLENREKYNECVRNDIEIL